MKSSPTLPTAEALAAIASPRRRRILEHVWHQELSAGELAARFDISWPAVSQHLTTLKQAGLIHERKDGRHRYYSADEASLGPLAGILRQMWEADLDRLAELAEAEEVQA